MAGLGVVAIVVIVTFALRRPAPAPEETPIDLPLQTPTGEIAPFALSPDGASILYANRGGRGGLVIHSLRDGTSRDIPGTSAASVPFFSADGREIGAISGAMLRLTPVAGGEARDVLELRQTFGLTQTANGTLVFAPGVAQPLHRAMPDGSQRRPLTTTAASGGDTTHRWPHAIAGTNAVLFTSGGSGPGTRVYVADAVTGASRKLIDNAFSAMYSATGHIVFARDSTLMAAPFDVGRLALTGEAVQIAAGVAVRPQNIRALYSLALDGTLVYVPESASLPPLRMVWVSRTGEITPVDAPSRPYRHPRLSPDGSRVAMWIEEQAARQVWTFEFASQRLSRLSSEEDSTRPMWSAEGRSVIYDGPSRPVRRELDSASTELPLLRDLASPGQIEAVLPDGSGVVSTRNDPASGQDLWLSSFSGRQTPLVTDLGAQSGAAVSPDSKWLAYTSGPKVFVKRLDSAGSPVEVAAGDEPVWSSNGRALTFRRGDTVFEAPTDTTGGDPKAGLAVPLFTGVFDRRPATRANYDVMPDGSRFLMLQVDPSQPKQPPLVMLTGWTSRLR